MKKIVSLCLFIMLFTTQIIVKANTNLNYLESERSETMVQGIKHVQINAKVTNDKSITSNQHINIIEKPMDGNLQMAVWSKIGANKKIIGATVLEIAQDFENKNPNYEVLAAVNGDYFFSGDTTVNANVLYNGQILNHDNHAKYFSVSMDHQGRYIGEDKVLSIGDYQLIVYNTENVIVGVFPFKEPNDTNPNEITIYHNFNQQTPTSIIYYAVDVLSYATENAGMSLIGSVSGKTTGNNHADINVAKIVSNNETLNKLLDENPKISVQRRLNDYNQLVNIIGVDSKIIENGEIRTFDQIVGQNESHTQSRHPRTGFGFKEDGTLVLFTSDGRQTSNATAINASGVDLREFAQVMKSHGIVRGYNLDGGGSTQMVLRDNDVLKVVNSPSEGPNFPMSHVYYRSSYRDVYNAMLIIKPKNDTKITDAFKENQISIQLYSDIETNHYAYWLNNVTYPLINKQLTLDLPNGEHAFSLLENGVVIFNQWYHVDSFKEPPVIPDIAINHTYTDKTLKINFTYNDPDRYISRIYLNTETQESRIIALVQNMSLRTATISNPDSGNYIFKITYEFHENILPVEINYSVTIPSDEEEIDDEQNEENPKNKNTLAIVLSSIGIGIVLILGAVLFFIKR